MRGRTVGSWVGLALLWLVTAAGGLSMIDAGWGKFEAFDGWWYWFTQFGFPGWFAPVIGVVEMVAGAAVLIPRFASYAAIVLIGVMVVAFYSVMTTPHTALSPEDTLVGMALMAIAAAGWWRRRFRPRRERTR